MKHGIILIGVLVSIFACSCSGGGPVSPDADIEQAVRVEKSADNAGHRMLWGLWQIHGDMRTGEIGIVPVRSGDLHLNALAFLEPPAGSLLKIKGPIEINGDVLDLDISLTHPFPAQTQFTGFDVKGIVITQGDSELFCGPLPLMADEDWTRMLNPDGYTLWWSPFHFPSDPDCPNQGYIDGLWGAPDSLADYDTTINGYKYFCDDLGPDDDLSAINPDNRGMFSTGKTNVRHYTIKVVGDTFEFNYAVDACWAWPENIPPFEIPGDFPAHANQPEAYRVEIEEVKNTLYYDGYFGGGDLFLDITVYTWRDPSTTLNVYIESPLVFHEVFSSEPIETGDGWARYRLEATSCSCRETGEIFVLVGVQTGLVKILTWGHYNPVLANPALLSAYFPYSIEVGTIPPTDGPTGFPRGFHPGTFKAIPEPPGYTNLSTANQVMGMRNNHIACGMWIDQIDPPVECVGILESFDGGQTFEVVVMDAPGGGVYADWEPRTLEVLIDPDDGVHLVGRNPVHHSGDPALSYVYKPYGQDPQEIIYPIGDLDYYVWRCMPFMDASGILHIVFNARAPGAHFMSKPNLFEITSADYKNFSDPIKCRKFPWSYFDEYEYNYNNTVFAMASDGELYVAFPTQSTPGNMDFFFSHGYPGTMSEPVKLDKDLPGEHFNNRGVCCQLIGNDFYVSWTEVRIYEAAYDYPAAQVCHIPDNSEPENPVDIVIPSSSWSVMCVNPFENVVFMTGVDYRGGNYIHNNPKVLNHRKFSVFSGPDNFLGNFILPSYGSANYAISETGIITIKTAGGYNPEYAFSEFDFY